MCSNEGGEEGGFGDEICRIVEKNVVVDFFGSQNYLVGSVAGENIGIDLTRQWLEHRSFHGRTVYHQRKAREDPKIEHDVDE